MVFFCLQKEARMAVVYCECLDTIGLSFYEKRAKTTLSASRCFCCCYCCSRFGANVRLLPGDSTSSRAVCCAQHFSSFSVLVSNSEEVPYLKTSMMPTSERIEPEAHTAKLEPCGDWTQERKLRAVVTNPLLDNFCKQKKIIRCYKKLHNSKTVCSLYGSMLRSSWT